MSAKLYALGRWCFRHARATILVWLLIALGLAGLAVGFHGGFNNDFEIPGAASQEALERLEMTFPSGAGVQATAIVVSPEGTSIEQWKSQIEDNLDIFEGIDFVESVRSPWGEFVSGQVSDNDRAALVSIPLDIEETASPEQLSELTDAGEQFQQALGGGVEVTMGGQAFDIELPALGITEVIGVVLAYVVLVVMLGSLITAAIPIVTAILGVGLTMALMFTGTAITTINTTTPILAVMLGLALGTDYALFIFSRHRDQLRAGMDVEESMARAVGTAGTAVLFAGMMNGIALSGMAVAGIPFLTVMGIFASVAVAFTIAIALTLLPAAAGLLGERMRPKARRVTSAVQHGDASAPAPSSGPQNPAQQRPASATNKPNLFDWWGKITTTHPVVIIVVFSVLVGALSIPGFNLRLSLPNAGTQPADSPARIAFDLNAEHFGPGANAPLIITAGIIGSDDPMGLISDLRKDVEAVDGVARVTMAVPNENADTALIQLQPTTGADDPATIETVERLHELTASWQDTYGIDGEVTGFTAVQMDVTQRLADAIVPFGVLVVGLTLVLLAAVFRSVWVPIKTTVGFLFSVGAGFGATELVFNEGILRQVINLEQAVPVISFLPIILMGILFGLAMDYEMFIVSRIREDYVHGNSAIGAIRRGLHDSGPVVTALAMIMFFVFAFFVPTGMMAMKAIAFALAISVVVDAFIVRMTLTPAVLALLGDRAWWMPRWLDKLLPIVDIEGEVLTRQLALQQWPGDGSVLHVEDLAVESITTGVSLTVRPGEVVGLIGPTGARTATAMAITGRLGASSGRGRVAGALLPDAASTVRRRTTYVDLAVAREPLAELRAITPRPGQVVVLDSMEQATSAAHIEAIEKLAQLTRQRGDFALVCCASSQSTLSFLQPDGVLAVLEPEGSLS